MLFTVMCDGMLIVVLLSIFSKSKKRTNFRIQTFCEEKHIKIKGHKKHPCVIIFNTAEKTKKRKNSTISISFKLAVSFPLIVAIFGSTGGEVSQFFIAI
jgi:hypothetical protein